MKRFIKLIVTSILLTLMLIVILPATISFAETKNNFVPIQNYNITNIPNKISVIDSTIINNGLMWSDRDVIFTYGSQSYIGTTSRSETLANFSDWFTDTNARMETIRISNPIEMVTLYKNGSYYIYVRASAVNGFARAGKPYTIDEKKSTINFLGNSTSPSYIDSSYNGLYQNLEYGTMIFDPIYGTFEVHGSILAKYKELGFTSSALGFPRSDESDTNYVGGKYNLFKNGIILWKPETGAKAVYGEIYRKYNSMSRENGFLKFPVTDELVCPDGRGRYNHFENGSIYWSPKTGAQVVRKEMMEEWAKTGYEKGKYGYPIGGDYHITNEVIYQDFQGGTLQVYMPQ